MTATHSPWVELFGSRKPILAMLHLGGDTRADRLDRVRREVRDLVEGGVDGVIVENYFGDADDVRAVLEEFSANPPGVAVGLNVLRDHELAFALASEFDIAFIQLDSVAGHLAPVDDERFAARLAELRGATDAVLLGGVRFKYQPVLSGRDEAEDLRIATRRCDAIVVTGAGTGLETDLEKTNRFRSVVGSEFPLVVGAGVTAENIRLQLDASDGVIVGSFLKDTYRDDGVVDRAHVEHLVTVAQTAPRPRPRSRRKGPVIAESYTRISPRPLTAEAFAPYGRVLELASDALDPAYVDTIGDGWRDRYTREPLISSTGSLGRTIGSGLPALLTVMERHEGTEEAILPAGLPLVLAVAAAGSGVRPAASDVDAFVIPATTVVVLHPGTWHDACHGLASPAAYFWHAATRGDRSSGWCELVGGPLLLEAMTAVEEHYD